MLKNMLELVGNTPMINIELDGLGNINLFAKLEIYNPTGSIKDRAASYILQKLLESGRINQDTTIIESSSGNFGISLSAYCKKHGLRFICVVDPNITEVNKAIIRHTCSQIIMVSRPDESGGYLLNRIQKVKELREAIPNSYWINQYANPYNAEAYYHTLGNELCNDLGKIDYIFTGVSSGGTITGLSKKIKERRPDTRIIAVDSVGSVIFGGKARKRYIPGIGSSMVPAILRQASIDDVIRIEELEAVKMCRNLLNENSILAGGSTGSILAAIKKYFKNKPLVPKPNVIAIFHDRGDRYLDTIYNDEWVKDTFSGF